MKTIFLTLFLLSNLNATAKILSQSQAHFVVSEQIKVSVAKEKLWSSIIQIESWWDGEHTYSGDAKNLYLDVTKEFCFCEKWPQGRVQHMQVVNVINTQKLTLLGGLGPLQNQAIHGVLDINISEKKGDVFLNWTYRVHGRVEQGLDKWAAAVNGVIESQFSRLKKQLDSQ